MVLKFKTFEKQRIALRYLRDNKTNEVLYGGGARGGKSWLGCAWILIECMQKPGSSWLVAREELTKLKDTTLLTFFKVVKELQFDKTEFHFNAQSLTVTFKNGSLIFFREIKYLPSDPEFDRLGSYDLTGCFLDESQQINAKAISVLKGRFSQLSGDGWKTIPKALYTCNPAKNWIYTDFVRPDSDSSLTEDRKFVKSLATDNPFVPEDYIENLKRSDNVTVQRLLYGNFDYDDDPTALCDYDAIVDCFTNDHVEPGDKAISADLAMQGRDRFILGSWDGLICKIKRDKPKAGGKEIETDVRNVMQEDGVGRSQTVVDSDGLGAYLESYLNGIKEFHGGAKAYNSEEFANLKSECGYKLAEVVNKREIKIICTPEQRQAIIEELGVLKSDSVDDDEKKKRILKKDKMKQLLGRSPDYLDMLLMRMIFLVKPAYKPIGIV